MTVIRSLPRLCVSAPPVADAAPQRERTLTGVGGVLPPVEQPRFVGEPVPQAGGRLRICPGREAQGPPERRRRLTVRGQLGRPPRARQGR